MDFSTWSTGPWTCHWGSPFAQRLLGDMAKKVSAKRVDAFAAQLAAVAREKAFYDRFEANGVGAIRAREFSEEREKDYLGVLAHWAYRLEQEHEISQRHMDLPIAFTIGEYAMRVWVGDRRVLRILWGPDQARRSAVEQARHVACGRATARARAMDLPPDRIRRVVVALEHGSDAMLASGFFNDVVDEWSMDFDVADDRVRIRYGPYVHDCPL